MLVISTAASNVFPYSFSGFSFTVIDGGKFAETYAGGVDVKQYKIVFFDFKEEHDKYYDLTEHGWQLYVDMMANTVIEFQFPFCHARILMLYLHRLVKYHQDGGAILFTHDSIHQVKVYANQQEPMLRGMKHITLRNDSRYEGDGW